MTPRLEGARDGDAIGLVHAQRNATWASHLAAALVANGLRHAVISPGSRNTPLVLALDAVLGDRALVVLDERSAGFVALGLARASGHPVALLCTSGSAAAHYFPAIIEAHYSRVPLVVMTADRPPELHHNGAGQSIEQENLYGDYVRWSASLGAPGDGAAPRTWGHMGAQAIGIATGPSPGPVHLNAAFREPLWAPGVGYGPPSQEALRIQRGDAAAPPSERVRERLAKAKRGVVVCGPRAAGSSLAADPGFASAVTKLGERLGWPVLADAVSGARRDGTITTYDALLRSSAFADAMRPDLVLRFGQLPASKPLAGWLNNASTSTILVEPSGALHDPASVADMLIACDATALCLELAKTAEHTGGGWLAQWKRAERAARRALDETVSDGFWEGAIAAAVGRSLPANALLHVASSMPVRDLEAFAARVPFVTANRGANGIDGTIATACGASLAWDGPTVALLGDLAFLHDVGSLATARALSANLTIVVVDNNGGGIFDFLPIADHDQRAFNRYFSTPQDVDVGAVAVAFGFTATKVGSLPELEQALAAPGQGCRVIHAVVDRSRNVMRHRASATAVAHALESSK